MKILSSQQIKETEQYSIERQGISSLELMERAAQAFMRALLGICHSPVQVCFVCGRGNNGGDGMAIARLLHQLHFPVRVYLLEGDKPLTPDAEQNALRLKQLGITVYDLNKVNGFPALEAHSVIVDALFGIGLNRPLSGWAAEVVTLINESGVPVFSVDMPSGLYADKPNALSDAIVRATHTFTFQVPKLSLLFCDNERFVGRWKVLPIGLDELFIHSLASPYHTISIKGAARMLKYRAKCSHKGTYGHALIMGGSRGKMGAAILSVKACLRSGAGLVTASIPGDGYNSMQTAAPEAMAMSDAEAGFLSQLPELSSFKAIGAGPGIGTDTSTAVVLCRLLQEAKVPMVLDADALNILSAHKEWLKNLPPHTILTPHPKEFDRLTHEHQDSWQRFLTATNFAREYHIILVLKGAYTSIHTPSGDVYFNTAGNPGMATGGAGDVLTGILTGLLAQGYAPLEAAILGVNLHGLAGDFAAQKWGEEAMIAGDIIAHLGHAFKEYHRIKSKFE